MKRSISAHFFCAFLLVSSHSLYSLDSLAGYFFGPAVRDFAVSVVSNWRNINAISGGPAESLDFFCAGATARTYVEHQAPLLPAPVSLDSCIYANLSTDDMRARCAQVCRLEIPMAEFKCADWAFYIANNHIDVFDINRTADFMRYSEYKMFVWHATNGFTHPEFQRQAYAMWANMTPEQHLMYQTYDPKQYGALQEIKRVLQHCKVNADFSSIDQHKWRQLDQAQPFHDINNFTDTSAFCALQSRADYAQQIQKCYADRNTPGTVGYQLFHDTYSRWNPLYRGAFKHEAVRNQILADVQSIANNLKASKVAERLPAVSADQIIPCSQSTVQVINGVPQIVVQDYTCPVLGNEGRAQAVQAPQKVVEMEYALADRGAELLHECDKNVAKYEHCSGVPAQQRAHWEFVGIVDRCSQMRYQPGTSQDFQIKFTHAIVDCADVGVDLAHKGHVGKAFSLSDFCDFALRIGEVCLQYVPKEIKNGTAKGLVKAGKGFVDMGNMAYDAAQLARSAVYCIATDQRAAARTVYGAIKQFGHAMEHVRTNVIGVQISLPGKEITIGENRMMYLTFGNGSLWIRPSKELEAHAYAAATQTAADTLEHARNHPGEVIEGAIAVGVDYVASGLMMNAAVKGAAQVYAVGKNAVQLEKAVQMLDKVRKETKLGLVGATPEGVKFPHSPMMHLMESAENAGQKAISRASIQGAQKAEQKIVQKVAEIEKVVQTEQKIIPAATAVEEALEYALDPNCMRHFFAKPMHNLDALVVKLGSRERVVHSVIDQIMNMRLAEGVFRDVKINVAGYDVYVRGRVMNGVPKLGTFFIK